MLFEITARRSKCDKGDYFYSLTINGNWFCGFYSLDIVMLRLKEYVRKFVK